jgi:tRNA nucleotidyltransferase (CCA-adding enzyme)
VLLHDVGKPDTFTLDESGVGHFYGHPKRSAEIAEEILRRLRCPNKLREQTVLLIENHDRPAPETEKSMSRLVAQLGEENLRLIFKMHLADAAGKAPGSKEKALPRIEAGQELLDKVLRDRDCFSIKQLKINGDDLIAAGVPKGPAVGAELKRIFELVVDGELENERGKLMEEVMRGRG